METKAGVLVATLAGRLDSANYKDVETELIAAIEGQEAVVLDLARLTYISSAGLRVILLAGKKMRSAHGKLALCALPDPVREVFEISGFLTIFDVYPDREAAIGAIGA